jgi:hypothetical protein
MVGAVISAAASSPSLRPLRIVPAPPPEVGWPGERAIRLHLFKRLILWVIGWLCGPLRVWNALTVRRRPGVVVLEPFGLGDALSLEPLLTALLAGGHEVTLAIKPTWQPLYRGVAGLRMVEATAPWTSYSTRSKYAPSRYLGPAFFRWVRALRREMAGRTGLDPRGDVRSLLILHLAGCRHVTTLSHLLATRSAVPWPAAQRVPYALGMQRWQANAQLLLPLGLALPGSCGGPHLTSARSALSGFCDRRGPCGAADAAGRVRLSHAVRGQMLDLAVLASAQ